MASFTVDDGISLEISYYSSQCNQPNQQEMLEEEEDFEILVVYFKI